MQKPKVLVTITDGKDIRDHDNRQFESATKALIGKRVFSLSCGIGSIDVDHDRLARLASLTRGRHIEVRGSSGIAQALGVLTVQLQALLRRTQVTMANRRQAMSVESTVAASRIVRLAVDLIILMDCSWSMLGMLSDNSWNGDKEKLPKSKQAAISLINSLNQRFDRVGVARFWDGYELLCPLTADFQKCKQNINRIEGAGGTALFKAIKRATESF
jgi:Mg-chelatase subunit ChlD